ncbi:hypothetical protein ANCDUO_10874 [Ancylostoma duodenale]|uniref:Integrase SAM-like N-terminal domain-containing protein n=1 Tax=Ancylostoma duodenale TaxID=51022 RepID=A0A0C2GPN7_9BILA|nr:hypothetical protein ANCDUO_10874 [Ancylostoma duodenale]
MDSTRNEYGGRLHIRAPAHQGWMPSPILMPGEEDFFADRFDEGVTLDATARRAGLQNLGTKILRALSTDRASSTLRNYKMELEKFHAWRIQPNLAGIPTPQVRNLYLAKCASEGKQKSLPVIVAALNYFCGQLTGVNKDIQMSLLEAERRTCPHTQHRSKILPSDFHKLIRTGLQSNDHKITQAAALALIQYKGLLRLSEARNLFISDLMHVRDNLV